MIGNLWRTIINTYSFGIQHKLENPRQTTEQDYSPYKAQKYVENFNWKFPS